MSCLKFFYLIWFDSVNPTGHSLFRTRASVWFAASSRNLCSRIFHFPHISLLRCSSSASPSHLSSNSPVCILADGCHFFICIPAYISRASPSFPLYFSPVISLPESVFSIFPICHSLSCSLHFPFLRLYIHLSIIPLSVYFTILTISSLCLRSRHCSEKAVVWDGAVLGGRGLWPVSQ